MSSMTTTATSFLVENCEMPFCKGCGHTHIIRKLNDALVQLKLAPQDICLVTDIGCIGLADNLFETVHSVHTTHGRSTAFATGIELADAVLAKSKMKTIVLIGDGGATIGLLHLVNAALLNVDVTVILANNFLFGMTGGQHSAFSPVDFVTATTPHGNLIPPLDICRLIADSNADFVARVVATDKDVSDTIAQAIVHPGFALVEIVELCTEHATTRNQLGGNRLKKIFEDKGQEFGFLGEEASRLEFGAAYTEKFQKSEPRVSSEQEMVTESFSSNLSEQVGIILAGSAGERVQSAAKKICEAAILSGLNCVQKNDNPVTQGSGFSLSEVTISPNAIHYTGIVKPTVVIVVSEDGLIELADKGLFDRLDPSTTLLIDSSLTVPRTRATINQQPFRREHGGSKAAIKSIEYFIKTSGIMPTEAFEAALETKN